MDCFLHTGGNSFLTIFMADLLTKCPFDKKGKSGRSKVVEVALHPHKSELGSMQIPHYNPEVGRRTSQIFFFSCHPPHPPSLSLALIRHRQPTGLINHTFIVFQHPSSSGSKSKFMTSSGMSFSISRWVMCFPMQVRDPAPNCGER